MKTSCVTFVLLMIGMVVNAIAEPLAISTISTGCGRSESYKTTTIGPLTVGLQDSCDYSLSTTLGSYEVSSNVDTGFGPAIPKVGVVDAFAHARVTGLDDSAPVGLYVGGEAEAGGSVTFFFTVKEIRTPPATSFYFNTYIEANAQASLEGFGTGPSDFKYEGSAGAFVDLPDGTRWSIEGDVSDSQSSWADGFSNWVDLDLPPNDFLNPFYEVTIGAGCYVGAYTGAEFTSRADCHATVDPTIRLDQEDFDARYGSDSFLLSEYYTLQFSANVNVVPVPPAVWLFGSGLLGLVGIARRKKA